MPIEELLKITYFQVKSSTFTKLFSLELHQTIWGVIQVYMCMLIFHVRENTLIEHLGYITLLYGFLGYTKNLSPTYLYHCRSTHRGSVMNLNQRMKLFQRVHPLRHQNLLSPQNRILCCFPFPSWIRIFRCFSFSSWSRTFLFLFSKRIGENLSL